MSRDWDESRWICGPAVAPKMFIKATSAVHLNNVRRESNSVVPPSVECAKNSKRLKPEKWRAAFDKDGRVVGFHKVLKAIVSGGVDHSIRPEVWEFLLGCYALGTTTEYRQQLREARRIRYRELIQQCHAMHSSIGSGTLAYTVGSKIMDVRMTSKKRNEENATETAGFGEDIQREYTVEDLPRVVSKEQIASWSAERFQSIEIETFEDSRESFGEGEVMKSALPSDNEGSDSGQSEAEGEAEGYSNMEPADYLRLPVRALFPKYMVNDQTTGAPQPDDASDPNSKQTDINFDQKTSSTSTNRSDEDDTMKGTDSKPPSPLANGADKNDEKVAEWLWTLHRIVVDVVRTDRDLKFYEDSRNMARMSDILAVYAWVDPATGYCQGMSDLLSPFILIYEDDADAFWCFESLLRRVRQNFQMDGPVGVMRQLQALTSILELTDAYIFKHFVNIGADSFHFAFRMLLVLFRRELSFGEALCMWEMMWAADFDHGISWALEYHCPELLVIKQPSTYANDESVSEENSYIDSGFGQQSGTSPLYTYQEQQTRDVTPSEEDESVGYLSRSPLCGLRAGNFWPRHSRHKIRTVSSLLGKAGDDELSVFVVAAILILNRSRFMKDVHSMDDAIKAFNDIQMEIKVRNCIRMAIKLRRKYQRRLVRRAALESRKQQQQLTADKLKLR